MSAEHAVRLADPKTVTWVLHQAAAAPAVEKEKCIHGWQKDFKEAHKLLVPIVAQGHWVLLVLEKRAKDSDVQAEPEKLTIRFYDSLQKPQARLQKLAQELVTHIVGAEYEQHKISERYNSWSQPKGTLVCGFAVIHWMRRTLQ